MPRDSAEIRARIAMILAAPTLVLGALVTSAGGLQVGRAGARPPTRHRVPLASAAPPLALLFDCDGVLADTERDGHRVSFNRVFGEKSLGFEWGVEQYGKLCEVGGGKERMTAHFNVVGWPKGYENPTTTDLEKPKGLPKDPERLALVKEMHARKTELFQELIATGVVPLRPGVLRLVDEAIAAGAPLAVCSTSNEAAVRTLVQTLMGDARYAKFEFYCGDAVSKKKPAPDVYLLASEKMGIAPSECVVIEDSGIGLQARPTKHRNAACTPWIHIGRMRRDECWERVNELRICLARQAAKGAKMTCLVTTSTYTAADDFAAADRVVSALGEPGDNECVTLDDLVQLKNAA